MVLDILEYPDPRLRKVATPVAAVTPEIRKLVRDMSDTMYSAPGIGLAAKKGDVHKRSSVIAVAARPGHEIGHVRAAALPADRERRHLAA